jgi:hypothetical protein
VCCPAAELHSDKYFGSTLTRSDQLLSALYCLSIRNNDMKVYAQFSKAVSCEYCCEYCFVITQYTAVSPEAVNRRRIYRKNFILSLKLLIANLLLCHSQLMLPIYFWLLCLSGCLEVPVLYCWLKLHTNKVAYQKVSSLGCLEQN